MKKYIVKTGSGSFDPLTEEQIKEACKNGKIVRGAQIASYIGFGVTGEFESICSVPIFGDVIKEREVLAEERRLQHVAVVEATLTSPLAKILVHHVRTFIQLNYNSPDSLEAAWLLAVNDTFFSVQLDQKVVLHVPLAQILHAIEGNGLAIRIVQLVVYKGSTSVGISVPLPQ